MPSILEQALLDRKAERKEIDQKVNTEILKPTDKERIAIRELIKKISSQYQNELSSNKSAQEQDALNSRITQTIQEEVAQLDLPYESKARLEKLAVTSIIGYGPIQRFLDDEEVTEIIVQRYDNICVERAGKIHSTKASFTDDANLINVIHRILQPVGREINITTPIVDARLSDGSRVNAVIPPISPHGATLTIRKFNNKMMTPQRYLDLRSLNEDMLEFLKLCVRGKISIYVSGGTGTGKTTFLNMLSSFLPENELIITIEDTLELQLKQKNVRSYETRQINAGNMMVVDMSALVKASLRQRPDRIIVGETRDGAVVSLLTAMSTGHEGSMSTGHANSPFNLVNVRIPTMIEMDKTSTFSERAQAMMISEALQLIVQLRRLPDGRRVVSQVTEVGGIDKKSGAVILEDIFVYNIEKNDFEQTGYYPKAIVEKVASNGVGEIKTFFRDGKEA